MKWLVPCLAALLASSAGATTITVEWEGVATYYEYFNDYHESFTETLDTPVSGSLTIDFDWLEFYPPTDNPYQGGSWSIVGGVRWLLDYPEPGPAGTAATTYQGDCDDGSLHYSADFSSFSFRGEADLMHGGGLDLDSWFAWVYWDQRGHDQTLVRGTVTSFTGSIIPEPNATLLLATGLAGLAAARRRRSPQ